MPPRHPEPRDRFDTDPFDADAPNAHFADAADLHRSPFHDADTNPHANPDAAMPPPVRVPHEQLSPEALRGLVEEYVTRDGTDPADAGPKAKRVYDALRTGKAAVYWDPTAESAQIVAIE